MPNRHIASIHGSGQRAGHASFVILLVSAAIAWSQAIIIDHTCTDIAKVPADFIGKAKTAFKAAYGHTSHGSQIVSGMRALAQSNPNLFGFDPEGNGQSLSLHDREPEGDLGNPDRTTWAQRTRDFLKGPGKERNLVMWSWCGQVGGASEKDIATYLDLMSVLEKEFPNVKFVYMTGHLDGSGKEGNLNLRNEQIRNYCRKNGKILFDFADIESFDPDGRINFMEANADDGCNYRANGVSGNWAKEWLAKNPAHGIALPSSAAHTEPLNAALKGRAFWWMIARLAGWNGKS